MTPPHKVRYKALPIDLAVHKILSHGELTLPRFDDGIARL